MLQWDCMKVVTVVDLYTAHNVHSLLGSKGMTRIGLQELFMLEENTKGTRGHSLKLAKMRCTRDCWWDFFLTE